MSHVVLFGAVEARPGLQVMNPDYEVIDTREGDGRGAGGRLDDPHRPHRARLRKGRRDDAEDAAPPGVRCRLRACPPISPIRFPKTCGAACGLPDRRTALVEAHFPRADAPTDLLNNFRTPAQVRADLRGVLSVPARLDDAQARGGAGIEAARHSSRRSDS